MLGLIGSYLFDRSDRRLRRIEDVETLFDLPVLGTIPHVRGLGRNTGDPQEVPAAAREPHRALRVNLDLARMDIPGRGKVIMVTSALPSEGKSAIVRGLAISYCEAGARVAVMEADLRRPVLAEQFVLASKPGLSEALSTGQTLHLQRVADDVENPALVGSIDVAVAGSVQENPTVLLTGSRMPTLLAELAETHDIVLIDTPPLLSVSDGLPLLGMVDGVLVVVRVGRTTYPAAVRLRQTVERLHGADVLGVVANSLLDELASYGYVYNDPKQAAAVEVNRPAEDVPAV